MEFALNEEQRIIKDSAQRFLTEHCDMQAVRATMSSDQDWDQALWKRIRVEMGWHAMHIPEEFGGLGMSYASLAVVLEETGQHLLCAPFFSSVCMATNALLVAHSMQSSTPATVQCLSELLSEGKTATLGWMCPDSTGYDLAQTTLLARRKNNSYVLDGEVAHVLCGASADILIVAAHLADNDNQDIALFMVRADGQGVSCISTPTMDQTRPQARIIFQGVAIHEDHLVADFDKGLQVLHRTLRLAGVALAAEQAGVARKCLEMSVRYACDRTQFGRPIGSFQAIKHQCADMAVKVESMRSAAWYAACVAQTYLEHDSAEDEFKQVASIAQSYCMEHCFSCAADSIQIHGGVGFTWEFDVHLFLKRAQSCESLFGGSALHQEQLAHLILDAEK